MAVHCRLRLGELLGLGWRDVDLTAGTLEVRRRCSATSARLVLRGAEERTEPASRAVVASRRCGATYAPRPPARGEACGRLEVPGRDSCSRRSSACRSTSGLRSPPSRTPSRQAAAEADPRHAILRRRRCSPAARISGRSPSSSATATRRLPLRTYVNPDNEQQRSAAERLAAMLGVDVVNQASQKSSAIAWVCVVSRRMLLPANSRMIVARWRRTSKTIYGGKDPRDVPAYSVGQVSAYLRIPLSTLRSWTFGRGYDTEAGRRQSAERDPNRLIPRRHRLSFTSVVELFVLVRSVTTRDQDAEDSKCDHLSWARARSDHPSVRGNDPDGWVRSLHRSAPGIWSTSPKTVSSPCVMF